MGKTKRFYWLKLKDDFFKSREMKKLRRIAGGSTYTIIYLKMQLLSIQNEGVFQYEGTEHDIFEQLALELDEEIDDIKLTMAYLQANGLLEQLSEDEYLLSKVPEVIGTRTDSADRMRRMRERHSLPENERYNIQEKQGEEIAAGGPDPYKQRRLEAPGNKGEEQKSVTSDADVTPVFAKVTQREERREKREEKESTLSGKPDRAADLYGPVIEYLNQRTGKNFRPGTKATQRLIKARAAEGFTLEDFKQVVDNRTALWATDPKMADFLRPETLFGTKFESYLQSKEVVGKSYKSYKDQTGWRKKTDYDSLVQN